MQDVLLSDGKWCTELRQRTWIDPRGYLKTPHRYQDATAVSAICGNSQQTRDHPTGRLTRKLSSNRFRNARAVSSQGSCHVLLKMGVRVLG